MIVTVFRSRLNPDAQDEYKQWASRMSTLAADMPGYISHKGFVAEDGERVTIVEFESEEGMRAWATHPEHVAAKKKGRSVFFTEFRVQVCNVVRDTADHWSRTVAARAIL
ncbi:antibiotic biosynthesis monooxygenase family protein [Burkholderia ubonensis]|uniref:antibiotic biosynthesis monooxygenase family protein n=1 Tax=Burkholderia ubonensis TaxID=101571 RepID=UPI002AB10571|nr:antibiotic biosynthesis monooxygenase [Burkholderia ubonensis]